MLIEPFERNSLEMNFSGRLFSELCVLCSIYAAFALENQQTFTMSATTDGGAQFAGMAFISAVDLQRQKRSKTFRRTILNREREERRDVIEVELSDPDDCILKCSDESYDRYKDVYGEPNMNSKASLNIFDYFSDVDKLVEFCRVFSPTASCHSYCPDSRLKRLASDVFSFAMLICQWSSNNYTDLRDALSNWKNPARSEATEVCKSRCENITDVTGSTNVNVDVSHTTTKHTQGSKCWITESKSRVVTYDNNNTRNSEIIRGMCLWQRCFTDCSRPIRKKLFGSKFVELDDDFNATVFKSLYNSLKELDAFEYEPVEECKPTVLAAPEIKLTTGGRPEGYPRSRAHGPSCNQAEVVYPSIMTLMLLAVASMNLFM